MRYLFLLLIFASVAYSQAPPIELGVSHDLAIWRAARYSDVRYKLNLTLEKMSPVLKGTIEIRVKVSEPPASAGGQSRGGEVPPIILDWRKIAGHEKDAAISNVTINGRDVVSVWSRLEIGPGLQTPPGKVGVRSTVAPKPDNADNSISYVDRDDHLTFNEGVVAGENVIKLDFTSPILTSGSAITRYVDKEDGSEYIYSLFVPSDASTAFPVFDQPDLKAKFSLTVNYPSEWKIVSNEQQMIDLSPGCIESLPQPSDEKSIKTASCRSFHETKPISTYVFAFAAGPFTVFRSRLDNQKKLVCSPDISICDAESMYPDNGTTNDVYTRKSQAAKFQPHADEVFRLTREGIKYLEIYFDYKFPWPKYDLVLIPEFPFGGMEHAGVTFLKEPSVIFPTEPTKGDYISRANLIFHETAHQWFGDLVTMRWFDDLWLKEGFAEFMAYKTLEKVMPDANAWKVFYERNKQAAYATDSTRGTTPIYQPIDNLSAAKSAYGNIVYRKAPSFLRQAEFYLGEDKFQTAVRAFLKKHEYANGRWEDLVSDLARAKCDLPAQSATVSPSQVLCAKEAVQWANAWVKQPGVPIIKWRGNEVTQEDALRQGSLWSERFQLYEFTKNPNPDYKDFVGIDSSFTMQASQTTAHAPSSATFNFPNYGDYGYGIFLLDAKSREYVLHNIQNEKDPFLRSMMWGALWDSVREGEMDPREYVELAIKQLQSASLSSSSSPGDEQAKACTLNCGESDESTIASILGRVTTAMNYYLPAGGSDLRSRLEDVLIARMNNAPTAGLRITFYRAFVNNASSENSRIVLKGLLRRPGLGRPDVPESVPTVGTPVPIKTKDRFDIVTRLIILGDPDAPKLLADLEKTETGDDAKRYAYAAHAAFPTAENRAKFWNDFVNNKDISESWIEAAMSPFNAIRHDDLSLPYLQRALAELPNLKRSRKIFFVNGWLGAFIGGQRSQEALDIVNKFLADNPNIDKDLRLKILENVDVIERAVKIRLKWPNERIT